MRAIALSLPICVALLGLFRSSGANPYAYTNTKGKTDVSVCSNLTASCDRTYKNFPPYELGLRLPKQIKPNIDYSSVRFYAVVLKTAPADTEFDCDRGEFSEVWEKERKRVQALFPNKKVFAYYQCPDMAAVSYTMNGNLAPNSFIAIYGGSTPKQAQAVLTSIKRHYKKAKVRPMQVIFNYTVQ